MHPLMRSTCTAPVDMGEPSSPTMQSKKRSRLEPRLETGRRPIPCLRWSPNSDHGCSVFRARGLHHLFRQLQPLLLSLRLYYEPVLHHTTGACLEPSAFTRSDKCINPWPCSVDDELRLRRAQC